MGRESHFSSKKARVFVRAIQGDYSLKDELARLRSMPRVVKGRELLFNDGPQSFSKHFIEPADGMTKTLHIHLEEYAPGGKSDSTISGALALVIQVPSAGKTEVILSNDDDVFELESTMEVEVNLPPAAAYTLHMKNAVEDLLAAIRNGQAVG